MSSDERLALRAARGDKRAFEEIYERYHQELYRFCLAMLANPQDAQDTLQNTMVKALRGLPGEEREIRLKPWLYRIAHNEAVETLRKRRDTVELKPHQATAAGVVEAAETRERLRVLLADLDQLPERQRAALVMRELSGLDFEQIGAAFGSSSAVARQTLYEARLSLRKLEAGREMRCQEVMRELSDGDGRVTRRREIRAHLRGCADCRAFRDQIARRHEDLAALAPLPIAASTGVLHAVLGGKASATGLAVTAGSGAGKAVATSAIVKSVATVAVVITVGVAADHSGLIHVPLPILGQAPTGGSERGIGPAKDGLSGVAAEATSSSGRVRAPWPAIEHAVNRTGAAAVRKNPSEKGLDVHEAGTGADAPAIAGGPSDSTPGSNPPGGGYGRSASSRHERPEGLPNASARGQEKAATHRADGAAATPGSKAAGNRRGESSEAGAQRPEQAPGREKAAPPTKSSPGEPQPPATSPPGDEHAASTPAEGPQGRQP